MLSTSVLDKKKKVRQFCQLTNSRTLYSIKSPSFLLRPFHFFSCRNFEPFVFSDDDEENKIKKDSKISINLFPGHILFFIYLFSFLRGGGWVSEWVVCTEGNWPLKIDWASLILVRKFTVLLCFTLYLRAISKNKPPGLMGRALKKIIMIRKFLRGWVGE